MKKALLVVMMLAIPGGVVAGRYAATTWRAPAVHPSTARADYDRWVKTLDADEAAVRDELNEMISAAKVPLAPADQARVGKLTFNCTDPEVLLEITPVARFVAESTRGEADPYAFVPVDLRPALKVYAGPNPTPAQVLTVRRNLVTLAAEFELLRQKPDWKVEVEGEALKMPMLDMLREGYEFMPYSKHPALRPKPAVPAFSPADAELLAQLDVYFNGARAKAAFPAAKFPKTRVNGRLPAIPTGLAEHVKEVQVAISEEKKLLLPASAASPEQAASAGEAVDEVFDKLERFLEAVALFGK